MTTAKYIKKDIQDMPLLPSIESVVMEDICSDFFKTREATILKEFEAKGYSGLTPEIMKKHCTIKIYEGDPFEHFYFDDIRIISIERFPELVNEGLKMKLEVKYY